MQELLQALSMIVTALWALAVAVGRPLLPWTPLAAWVIFWLFCVNWLKLRGLWAKGGWLAIVLLGAAAVLVWGTVSPTPGTRDIFGLHVSNFVEKTIYVSGLIVIANLAGSVQLSGALASCCPYREPELVSLDEHHAGHEHDDHGTIHASVAAHH